MDRQCVVILDETERREALSLITEMVRKSGRNEIDIVDFSTLSTERLGEIRPEVSVFLTRKRRSDGTDGLMLKLCDRTGCVVLNLQDPELVRISEESPSEILWFASQPPEHIAGPLMESFSGAYYSDETGQVVFCEGSGRQECYDVDSPSEAVVAAICVARAIGIDPSIVSGAIQRLQKAA